MSKMRQVWQKSLWLIFGLLIGLGNLYNGSSVSDVAAQSAGDTLSTPTPVTSPGPPNQVWVGRLVSNTLGVTEGQGSIFRVSVEGLPDVPIELRIDDQLIVANSGSKPEYGPYAAEFAPITKGTWRVSVPSIGASIDVTADNYNLVVIEFVQIPAAEVTQTVFPTSLPSTPTFTPLPATATPTMTPAATDTPVATPSPTPPPLPTATPITRWLGAVEVRANLERTEPGRITVRVAGIEGLSVRLSGGATIERRCITGQAEAGQDACIFDQLTSGRYLIAPEGLGVNLPVTLLEHEAVEVRFEVETLPAGVAGWQGRLLQNTGGSQALPQADSIIRVRVAGRNGQIVALRSIQGVEKFCEVASNPVLGALACEFGQLGPGVYTVEAVNTGAALRVFVDGAGQVDIEFSPTATSDVLAARHSPAVVGRGARPTRSVATTVPTNPPPPTSTPLPAIVVEPTPVPTDTPVPTTTPAFAWQGRVVESRPIGGGVIAVRAIELKDHPVLLSSGTWQSSTQFTGSKPELGDYSAEFGGLGPGRYVIELVDLAEFAVDLPSGQFILVEFRYDPVNP